MSETMMGKVALVTGSTSGIGRGIAQSLASRGCSVVLTGIATDQEVEELLQEFQSQYKGTFHFVPGNFLETESTEKLCQDVLAIYPNGVDILINNAGWGRIVNMSSQMGLIADPEKSAYCASKAGLIGFSRVIALEGARHGITCNPVCPGYADAPLGLSLIAKDAAQKGITFEQSKAEFANQRIPMGRLVPISEIAELVAFLCSDSASSISGTPIPIDGANMAR